MMDFSGMPIHAVFFVAFLSSWSFGYVIGHKILMFKKAADAI